MTLKYGIKSLVANFLDVFMRRESSKYALLSVLGDAEVDLIIRYLRFCAK